jgi:integrase
MIKHNPENERIKHLYLRWLRDAQGQAEPTLDAAAAAIAIFEAHTRWRPFKSFRFEQAVSFKEHLASYVQPETGKPLAKATLYARLKAVRAFFEWLSREPGYRSHVHLSDAAYFRLSANDARVATARRNRPYPSLEQVQHVIRTMPRATVWERRDRGLVALVLLTGARDSAVASLCVKHLNLARRELSQDAREVKTKRRKTFKTWFFPVGEDALEALTAWEEALRQDLLFGPDDPLFPVTARGLSVAGLFQPTGVERRHWTSADPIREAFAKAFKGAGLPYYGPHSIRRTLVALAYDLNLGPREMKAWSQNLGHENLLTTFSSYGALSPYEQAETMARLAAKSHGKSEIGDEELIRALASRLGGRAA